MILVYFDAADRAAGCAASGCFSSSFYHNGCCSFVLHDVGDGGDHDDDGEIQHVDCLDIAYDVDDEDVVGAGSHVALALLPVLLLLHNPPCIAA